MKSNFDTDVFTSTTGELGIVKIQYDTDTRLINDMAVLIPYLISDLGYENLYKWNTYVSNANPPFDLVGQAIEEVGNFFAFEGLCEDSPKVCTPSRNRQQILTDLCNDINYQFYLDAALTAAALPPPKGGKIADDTLGDGVKIPLEDTDGILTKG